MVTIFSALSSSSDTRMRFNRSLCGAALAGAGAATFLVGLRAAAGLDFFAGFAVFLTAFLAGDFFATFAFLAGFLAAFRVSVLFVRGRGLAWPRQCHQGPVGHWSFANCAAHPTSPERGRNPADAKRRCAGPTAHATVPERSPAVAPPRWEWPWQYHASAATGRTAQGYHSP